MKRTYIILFLGLLIWISSCASRKTSFTILGSNSVFITVYNGNKTIIEDSLNRTSPITGVSKEFVADYNFSDSIYVIMKFPDGTDWIKKTKIPKSKYIYIEVSGVEFNVYGANKRKQVY